MAKQVSKLSCYWVKRMRTDFKEFLGETHFPNPKRMGTRGPEFEYPEWLIMFIAILSVKCKAKNYQAIHRITVEYWDTISEGLGLTPISETQLRDRLKKICHFPRKPAAFIFQLFPQLEEKACCER